MAVLPASSAICARATARQGFLTSRTFTTTSTQSRNIVPPQSPSYIRLPSPPQSDETKKPRVRGRLPVARDIFPRRDGDRKIRSDYVKNTAPTPKQEPDITDAAGEPNQVRQWKREMADKRRDNLRESLQSLWHRRQAMDSKRSKKISANFYANKKAVNAPEREDDRITRSTVLDSMMDTSVKPDPDRFLRANKSRAKVQALHSRHAEARRDAVMELYVNAGNFIVSEADFQAEIEKQFADDYFRKKNQAATKYGAADNVWGTQGPPTSLAEMVRVATDTTTRVLDSMTSEHDRSVKRTKRIAEEFTGGKMD